MLGGAALATANEWHRHTATGIALLLAVGVSAADADAAYARGRTMVNASLQYLGIAFSFAYGVTLFDDRVTWIATSGMLLIVCSGVAATRLRTQGIAPTPRT